MRILTRYILFECVVFFGICLFAFTGILFTIQMLRFSDLIINRGVRLDQIALVFLAITPTFLELAVPMSALLGVMLAVARLSGDSEIVVLRSSGISIYQIAFPILFFAVALGGVGLGVSTVLKPWGYRTLSTAFFDIARSRSTAGLEEGVFNKLGNVTLYGQTVDYDTGELRGVMVDDRRDEKDRKIIFAKTGSITSNPTTQIITISLHDGSMHEQPTGKYELTHFINNDVEMSAAELYGDQDDTGQSPRSLYIPELQREIPKSVALLDQATDVLKSQPPNPDGTPLQYRTNSGEKVTLSDLKKRVRRLRLEYAMRFSMPYASFILSLVAMPLGIQPPRTQRTWGPTVAFGLGLAVFVLYYGILSLGMTLVDSGILTPALAAWLPNIVCTVSAISMLYAVASERIQSVPQIFENWKRFIPKILLPSHA